MCYNRSGTWVEANIVETKALEIDYEALGEVHKFIIWLWDSKNIYGLHSTSTWITPMMCFKYLGVSIVTCVILLLSSLFVFAPICKFATEKESVTFFAQFLQDL
jgi:hypothetical protein